MEPSHRAVLVASMAIVLMAVLPALLAPDTSGASPKPRCDITRPFDNATVSGDLRVTGTANMATDPIIKVQLRIDGGSLLIANGTDSWHFDIDTSLLSNGRHSIEAKSFDGTQYSDPASVTFSVRNKQISAPDPGPPYLLMVAVIIIVAAVAVAVWRVVGRGNR